MKNDNPFVQARIKENRNGFQRIEEVAEETKIPKTTIYDLESGKERGVNYKTVAILAKHYGVTTDFLCGVSPIPTVDTNIRMICDYTGLSQKAVEALHYATLPDEIEMDLPDVYVDKNGNVTKANKNVPRNGCRGAKPTYCQLYQPGLGTRSRR